MKLTNKAIEKIGDKTREAKGIRLTLAMALNFTEFWVGKCIKDNKDNGPLTKEKSLQIIEKSTGLKRSQILMETTEDIRA